MKIIHLLYMLTLTACGAANEAKDAQTGQTPTTQAPLPPASTAPAPAAQAADPAAKAPVTSEHRAPTRDEQLRLLTRMAFDSNYKKGNVFEVAGLYYIIKGNTGTMLYPDVTYVPQAHNASGSCPVGFQIPDMIVLIMAQQRGLFTAMPPDKTFVWTSDKAPGDTVSYYAMASTDYTDQWGFSFNSGLTYAKHGARIDGQVYCMLPVANLPRVEDLPDFLQDTLNDQSH